MYYSKIKSFHDRLMKLKRQNFREFRLETAGILLGFAFDLQNLSQLSFQEHMLQNVVYCTKE